jgi:hypothetical protein
MKKIIEFVKMFLGFAKETTTDIKEISNKVLEIVEISNKIEEEETETIKEEKPVTGETTPAPKKAKKRYYPKKKK